MRRFTFSDSLADAIAHQHWAAIPGAWASPCDTPYATDDDVLAALRRLYAQLESADNVVVPRVWVGGQATSFSAREHLPAEGETFAEWEARLRASFGTLGMVIGEAQSLGGALWTSAIAVARAIYARRGMVPGGASGEIFFGNYRQSFFALHKDVLETLTFIVRGRKRFLVWPYEVFADQAEAIEAGGVISQIKLPDDFDYEPFRAQATVLEGGPGDVLFWPASYWHIAEGVDDDFVTTLTVAFYPQAARSAGCPFRIASDAVARFAADGFNSGTASYPAPLSPEGVEGVIAGLEDTLRRMLEDETARRARREFGLMWVTAYGFKRTPEEIPAPELGPTDVIEVDADNPLRWIDGDQETFPTSVNGLVVTATPAYLPLVRHLNRGGRFVVGDLVTAFAGGELAEQDILDALGALGSVRFYDLVT